MGTVCGQDYPNKPIRIVTAAAGGGSDFTARQLAQGISGPLGQPVIVDNRPQGFIAVDVVSKAPSDGYTLTIQGASLWLSPLLRKVPYDVADFSPISLVVREVFVVAVNPSVPANSVKDLIALAKAKPGGLNHAVTGLGGTSHLAAELFKSLAGVNMVLVSYKGSAAATTALISGEVQMWIADAGLAMPQARSGKVRALAVTAAEPSALTPGLLTVAASGLPGYEMVTMTGLFAPARTARSIISRLNQEVVRATSRAEVKERFLNAGFETFSNSPEQFAATIRSEMTKFGAVIRDAGIKAD